MIDRVMYRGTWGFRLEAFGAERLAELVGEGLVGGFVFHTETVKKSSPSPIPAWKNRPVGSGIGDPCAQLAL